MHLLLILTSLIDEYRSTLPSKYVRMLHLLLLGSRACRSRVERTRPSPKLSTRPGVDRQDPGSPERSFRFYWVTRMRIETYCLTIWCSVVLVLYDSFSVRGGEDRVYLGNASPEQLFASPFRNVQCEQHVYSAQKMTSGSRMTILSIHAW